MFVDIETLKHWIKHRQNIYRLKEQGYERPWTKDPILDSYRFCNVYREQDAVTVWIRENLRSEKDARPWFTMIIARLLNEPATLKRVKKSLIDPDTGTVKWDSDHFEVILENHKARGNRVFNPAYIVSTNGIAMDKILYVSQRVLQPLWDDRRMIGQVIDRSRRLREIQETLTRYQGLGSFMSAQVIADLKYYKQFQQHRDWDTFAASGPGSRRGMNRLLGVDARAAMSEAKWQSYMSKLYPIMSQWAEEKGLPHLHAQDLQNCLCEYDKYVRCKSGEGRPKQKY